MPKTNLFFLLCVALALSFSGCNQPKPTGLPSLLPLTLTLTQDGTPLSGASVTLFADDGMATWTVGGTTGVSGNVSPMTQGKYPGVPAGKYKVCVFKIEAVVPPGAVPPTDSESQSARPVEYDLVDVKLRSPATTTLTLEVGPGKKTATLDVGKPIRERINTNGA